MWRSLVTTALDVAATALITAGAALIYVPSAFIVAGIGVLAVSYRLTASIESEDE